MQRTLSYVFPGILTGLLGIVSLVPLQSQGPQTPATPVLHTNGSYTGPGDTVPPPCTGPGCPPPPPPPPPPPTTICNGPCDFLNPFPCPGGPCHGIPSPLPNVTAVAWYDAQGNPVAPQCMQGPGEYRVYHITIQDLFDADAASNGLNPTFANLCFIDTCPEGVEAVFVYPTLPFRYSPYGLTTSDGGQLPACGMAYDLRVLRDNGMCEDLGTSRYGTLRNNTYLPLDCAIDISQIQLTFDAVCLNNLLSYYGSLGLYNWNPLGSTWINPSSVAFAVLVKCCSPLGQTCF